MFYRWVTQPSCFTARCLRLLATNHIYREVKPDVFANNRISSYFDTMKPSAEVIAYPDHKHDNTIGLTAVMGHALDEHFKASAYLWENASNPKIAKSVEPTDAPFAMAVGDGRTFWDWVEEPENAFRRRRFDIGMSGAQVLIANAMISAYDWESLPAKTLVVDVGGGAGSASLALAKEFPNLRFVVQDCQSAIEIGIEVWRTELPKALLFGRVQFQPHNFFAVQPQRNVSIFLLKNVLHCWSDKYCLKILKQLRNAASFSTKLICLEMILPYACHDEEGDDITAGASPEAPKPLLANWGSVNDFVYLSDIAMLVLSNSQERTMRHFNQLFRSAGWNITAVLRQLGADVSPLSSIEATPI
ncbi:hypothetical protein AX14_011411 [Amanita brunnescens Koide BX004]|nr:hypothetical protein AX14_011411 [Amanita brunnescens Koide BX004]